jgi:hypothetical protein
MTRNRFKSSALSAAVILLSCLATPMSANAGEDTKWYPGAICQQGGINQSLDYWYGRVRNRAKASAIADCPFVKDHIPGVFDQRSTAYVIDRSATEDVRCTLFSFDVTSSAPSFNWVARQSSGDSPAVQALDLPWGNQGVFSGGNLMVGCRIPGRKSHIPEELGRFQTAVTFSTFEYSEIVGFKIEEDDILD